jgi:hypothetical protein
MAKKNESKQGAKVRAGQLLSRFLRQAAEEITELGSKDGEDVLISKAEKMAAIMWKEALGYEEVEIGKQGQRIVHVHKPDKTMIGLIYERMEGRAPLAQEGSGKQEIPDRVDEQARNRINAAGGDESVG